MLPMSEETTKPTRPAENPSTPETVLEALAKDDDENVRIDIADNPSTPASVLEALAKDKETGSAVCCH
jgi:hypothetical protein